MAEKSAAVFLFRIMPKSLLSRIFGFFASVPLPRRVLERFITWYSGKYGVADEYITPEQGFSTINEFFTRPLRNGARRIDNTPGSVISPVDAKVDQFGPITGSTLIQAKGLQYTLEELIPSESAGLFRNGSYITLYLSPGDYHRIHSPVSGNITGYFSIPGKLYTVQEFMVRRFKGLFAINERLITYIDSPAGLIAVCMVGAMNVGKISLTFRVPGSEGKNVATNRAFRRREEVLFTQDKAVPVLAGGEIARFNLGSTVILLFQKEMVKLEKLQNGVIVRVGEVIARFS